MICTDCGHDTKVDKSPCPAHPVDEFLGYLQGEGVSWRRAGQHSYTVRFLSIGDLAKEVLKIIEGNLHGSARA